jgi:hypothetical protein
MTRLEDGRVTYALFFIVKTTRRIPKPRTKQCFEGIRGKEKAMQQYHMMIFCFHHCLCLISQSNQRLEDKGQCLFGIYGNSIPLLVTFEFLQ